MKKPTKEEIREKAQKYVKECGERDEVLVRRLVNFAESLFKENEEETWARIRTESIAHEGVFSLAKRYHEERKRIENE